MKSAREILINRSPYRYIENEEWLINAMKEYAEQYIDKCSQKVGLIKLTEGEVSTESILKVKELLK